MIKKLFEYIRKYKLRNKMIVINAIIAIIPLILIGAINYYIYFDNQKKNVSDLIDVLFNQINGRLEEYFNSIDGLSKGIFYNSSLQKFIMDEPNPFGDKSLTNPWEIRNDISDYFFSFMEINDSIKGVNLIGADSYSSNTYELSEDMMNYVNNFNSEKLKTGKIFFSGAFTLPDKIVDEYLAIREVKSLRESKYLDEIARGVLVLDRKKLQMIIDDKRLKNNSEIYIVGENDRIIASTNSQEVGKPLEKEFLTKTDGYKLSNIDGTSYMIKLNQLNKVGWKLVAVVSMEQVMEQTIILKYMMLVIMVIVLVIIVMVTLYFNIITTKPLKKLSDAFEKVAIGDLDVRVSFSSKNEITSIADSFNKMVVEIKALTSNIFKTQQKLYEIELEKKQFELNGLQSQINSHFLYNTLQCIRGMALTNAVQEIGTMIENLVMFFKYNNNNNTFVTLEEEFKHLEAYMNIQKLRFGNKFRVVFNIEANIKHFKILKLTLQPIIENAVFHGLEQKNGKGIIKITAYRNSSEILIKVLDNGAGMEKSTLDILKKTLCRDELSFDFNGQKRSIGLVNIQKRIQIYYGNKYGINVKSWKGIGTAIILKVPFVKGDF